MKSHAEHDDRPCSFCHCPLAQSAHAVVVDEKRPAGQATQAEVPATPFTLPAGQAVHEPGAPPPQPTFSKPAAQW
jgi:hypothetical protein